MKLLHWIFSRLDSETRTTWISRKFHEWKNEKMDLQKKEFKNGHPVPSEYFEVPGAREIRMSQSCHHACGHAVGFSFGVEWGRFGYTGGVIGRDEAKRMAEFIILKCSETDMSMEDEYNEINKWRESAK